MKDKGLSRAIALLSAGAAGYRVGAFFGFFVAMWLSNGLGDAPWLNGFFWAFAIIGPAAALASIGIAGRLTGKKTGSRARVTAAAFAVLALIPRLN